MALKLLQYGRQAVGILGAHPIQFETVPHQHGDLGLVFRDPRLQGSNPGVELLFGQLLGQLFHTIKPQLIARTGAVGWGNVGRHKTVDRQPIIGRKKRIYQKFIHRLGKHACQRAQTCGIFFEGRSSR